MKAEAIRTMAQAEVELQLHGLRVELYNLRIQQATRQLRSPARIRQVKRDIARILTIMQQRDISAS